MLISATATRWLDNCGTLMMQACGAFYEQHKASLDAVQHHRLHGVHAQVVCCFLSSQS